MEKIKIVLFIAGNGGHKTQIERVLNHIENSDLSKKEIKKIIFYEKGYKFSEDALREYEFLPLRDKYSYVKTLKNLILTICKQIKVCVLLNREYEIKGIISTGPGIVIFPSFIFKLLNKKIIFIETWSRFYSKSMTGRIMYKIADKFYIQNEELKQKYPKAIYGGRL